MNHYITLHFLDDQKENMRNAGHFTLLSYSFLGAFVTYLLLQLPFSTDYGLFTTYRKERTNPYSNSECAWQQGLFSSLSLQKHSQYYIHNYFISFNIATLIPRGSKKYLATNVVCAVILIPHHLWKHPTQRKKYTHIIDKKDYN